MARSRARLLVSATAMILVALVIVGVSYHRELGARYYAMRLGSNPELLKEWVAAPKDSLVDQGVERFLSTDRGARVFLSQLAGELDLAIWKFAEPAFATFYLTNDDSLVFNVVDEEGSKWWNRDAARECHSYARRLESVVGRNVILDSLPKLMLTVSRCSQLGPDGPLENDREEVQLFVVAEHAKRAFPRVHINAGSVDPEIAKRSTQMMLRLDRWLAARDELIDARERKP